MNNTTEIKINLVRGDLLYFHDEKGYIVDLTREYIYDRLRNIGIKYNINIPQISSLTNLNTKDLADYLAFATKANRSLELFRMKLIGHFTQVHLWPDGFDFSIEWFTDKNEEQIGVGKSPGGELYESPYLYVNPYPFNEKLFDESVSSGTWHTDGCKGIKVEWKDLEYKAEKEISDQIHDLFQIAQNHFQEG